MQLAKCPTANSSNVKSALRQLLDPRITLRRNRLPAVVQGNYAEAEPLYRQSLAITEKTLGPEHPGVATPLNNLAGLLNRQVITSFCKARSWGEMRLKALVRDRAGH